MLLYLSPADTLAQFLFLICRDYVPQLPIDLMKEKKGRSRRYPVETIMDADDADDPALLANATTQRESLLYNLMQAQRKIGLYVNSDKIELKCFKRNDKPLKFVQQFIFLGGNISSAESDVNIRNGKTWTAIVKLSTIYGNLISLIK